MTAASIGAGRGAGYAQYLDGKTVAPERGDYYLTPDGELTEADTYNATGAPTGIEYEKKTNCTEKCVWFSDKITPSIHGETLSQTSSLATERYAYDQAGRLTEAQEEPAGKPCASRLYGYDEESNRTGLTSREGSIGKCATEGGTTEHHQYDAANRLTDVGVNYETFGNATKLPAADAGKYEITSTYYVDSQLATQTQSSETLSYTYDPTGRTLSTHNSNTNSTTVSHYAGPGGSPTWTNEGTGVWTRNIPGIDGTLTATQTSAGTIELQLHDLQGNIVGKASRSETETKLLSTYNSTEFGVPQPGTTPPKYAWLGATGLSTELSSGQASRGSATYVPLIGRPLQTGPIASPGAFPDGTATVSVVQASYSAALDGLMKAIGLEHVAAVEAAARQQAEEQAAIAKCPATACHVDGPGEGNVPSPTEGGAEELVPTEESIYDPEGLASYNTTLKRAQQLRNDAAAGLGVALLADLIAAGAAEGGAAYAQELLISAESLDACVEIGKATPGRAGRWGTCYINENRFAGVPVSARAEFCEYKETRQWGRKPHNVYYCTRSGVDTWAPWY